MQHTISIFWFRRDLRLQDNASLYHALKSNKNVLPIFIFDTEILGKLDQKNDARVSFLHHTICSLQDELLTENTSLVVLNTTPIEAFKTLLANYKVDKVYANKDYEGYAIKRDNEIKAFLQQHGVELVCFKDHVIFEEKEVVKDDGLPYTVFTPYSRKWKAKLDEFYSKSYPSEKYLGNFYKQNEKPIPTLGELGFEQNSDIVIPNLTVNELIISKYTQQRDFPAINGTSKLGIHLRFGTISVRKLLQLALTLNETFVNELIWRDFYHAITFNFPHINDGKSFRKEYDLIAWRNNEVEFDAWCNGKTGYPIVDAGMRELNATGFMHNRVRMIVASFLCKHLLIDWRWGEAYFAKKLLDFDFSANNGGWQWAAGSGCDAAPYFRVFNPTLQTQKFDKDLNYIKKWVPELDSFSYPKPIVVHEEARKRCLQTYAMALKK
ncbi:MAG: cryptochrome/photolyase family protein [Chitinophagaceae bacterium]